MTILPIAWMYFNYVPIHCLKKYSKISAKILVLLIIEFHITTTVEELSLNCIFATASFTVVTVINLILIC